MNKKENKMKRFRNVAIAFLLAITCFSLVGCVNGSGKANFDSEVTTNFDTTYQSARVEDLSAVVGTQEEVTVSHYKRYLMNVTSKGTKNNVTTEDTQITMFLEYNDQNEIANWAMSVNETMENKNFAVKLYKVDGVLYMNAETEGMSAKYKISDLTKLGSLDEIFGDNFDGITEPTNVEEMLKDLLAEIEGEENISVEMNEDGSQFKVVVNSNYTSTTSYIAIKDGKFEQYKSSMIYTDEANEHTVVSEIKLSQTDKEFNYPDFNDYAEFNFNV